MYQSLKSPNLPKDFNGKNKVKVQLWYLAWLFIYRPSPHAFNFIRIFLLRIFGADITYTVKLRPSSFISYPWNLKCGENCFFGDGVYIDCLTDINIGNNVSISNFCYITSGTHDYESIDFDLVLRQVTIEDEVWLAVRSIVLPGVVLARGSVVGAGSVLTKCTNENQIWAGVPARFVRNRVDK